MPFDPTHRVSRTPGALFHYASMSGLNTAVTWPTSFHTTTACFFRNDFLFFFSSLDDAEVSGVCESVWRLYSMLESWSTWTTFRSWVRDWISLKGAGDWSSPISNAKTVLRNNFHSKFKAAVCLFFTDLYCVWAELQLRWKTLQPYLSPWPSTYTKPKSLFKKRSGAKIELLCSVWGRS